MNPAPIRKKPHPSSERRKPPAKPAGVLQSLLSVVDAMRRPIGIERRGRRLRLVFKERRQPATEQPEPPNHAELAAELHRHLVAYAQRPGQAPLRHLLLVARELLRRGWKGVEVLPSPLIGEARAQADLLAGAAPSAAMVLVIEQLRDLEAKARVREQRKAELLAQERSETLEVYEATHEEFDASERSWFDELSAPQSETGAAGGADKPG